MFQDNGPELSTQLKAIAEKESHYAEGSLERNALARLKAITLQLISWNTAFQNAIGNFDELVKLAPQARALNDELVREMTACAVLFQEAGHEYDREVLRKVVEFKIPDGLWTGSVRYEVPLPGPALGFNAWCRILTAELRRYLPDVAAVVNRRGDRVTWRYQGEEVVGHNERGCYRLRLNQRFGGLQDVDRHDAFTATNFAKTLAGHFDAQFSLAESRSVGPRDDGWAPL